MKTVCQPLSIRLILLTLFFTIGQNGLFFISPFVVVADVAAGSTEVRGLAPNAEELMAKALDAEKNKDITAAIELYRTVHDNFPDDPVALDALWKLAQLRKKLSLEEKGDWEDTRDAFRDYISFYPGAENIARAYFEVGVALYFMHYRREALTYFKLSVKRLPDPELAGNAQLWQAKVLLEIGRIAEAGEKYADLASHGDAKIRLRARLGQAKILNSKKQFESSLKIYHELAGRNANFFLDAPEALPVFGQANLLAGNVERGRDQLLHYLNIADGYVDRPAILFQVGESYWHQKKYKVAQKMYQRVVDDGKKGGKFVVFSQMRIAQYLDDPLRMPAKWERPHDLTDPQWDKPYLDVLDQFYAEPIAQDARLGLFRRFAARSDLAGMRDYGQNYLRIARLSKTSDEDKQISGQVLLQLVEGLLADKKYQDVYDLYYSEHQHVKEFHNGRLLYLVGQAMESMAMYDQAAVIYYRALKWPMNKDDKIDLYYRRANVYLLINDLASAERLLKYLRKVYAGKKELGEIMSYSGWLREAQSRDGEALAFYRKAAEIATFPRKKVKYASDVIRLASSLDISTAMGEINSYKTRGLLEGNALQEWYSTAGNSLREQGKCVEAISAYEAALNDDLPVEGKVVQSVHLYLGDCLVIIKKEKKALGQYKIAREGADELLKSMAVERLNQQEIDGELARLKSQ